MMNTPWNGYMEGALLGVQVQRIPTDEAVRPWYVPFRVDLSCCLIADLGYPPPLYVHMRDSAPCSAPNLGPQDKPLKQTHPPTPQPVSSVQFSALT